MIKKVFGITTSILPDLSDRKGSDIFGLYRDYVDAISIAGGVSLLLPPVVGVENIRFQLRQIDVLVISGGTDVNPICYGEEPHPLLESVMYERDQYEILLINLAEEMGIPIFGICRGLQIVNVAFGGSLLQDLSLGNAFLRHRQVVKQYDPSHSIEIKHPSFLYDIFGQTNMVVNSYHHQAIHRLAPGFFISAYSKDGIIEAIERRAPTPILAVQWHPEMMAAKHTPMLELFRFFAR